MSVKHSSDEDFQIFIRQLRKIVNDCKRSGRSPDETAAIIRNWIKDNYPPPPINPAMATLCSAGVTALCSAA